MPANSNQELQRNITKICHHNGLTRKDVMSAVDIKGTKRELTVDELVRISSYLKVTIKDLFTNVDKQTPNLPIGQKNKLQ